MRRNLAAVYVCGLVADPVALDGAGKESNSALGFLCFFADPIQKPLNGLHVREFFW